jgi:hypothetical protein
MIGALVCLYVLGRGLADTIVQQFGFHLSVTTEPMMHRLIMTATSVYIMLMAMPFMPGIEIGITMILFFGPNICFLIYTSTVLALTLSYLAGRLIPTRVWAQAFGFFGLTRAQGLMVRIAPLSADERFALLLRNTSTGIAPFLLRHRFLTLAIVLNLPGNILIGGGGGIGLIAGATGLFPLWKYLLTIALAVAPVPLIVSFTE